MGMFDYLQCDMPLPEGAPQLDWQTKNLECAMDYLAIRADGQLVNQNIRMEEKPGAPPRPNMFNEKGSELGIFNPAHLDWCQKWMERKVGPDTPIDYTGEVRFYAAGPDRVWWEFVVFCENGVCFKIVQVAP